MSALALEINAVLEELDAELVEHGFDLVCAHAARLSA